MNRRLLAILALTLCVGAFLFPMTAYAASGGDTAPPTVKAWISGENLHVEASDDQSGVEAVFINNARVNYRVDGAFDVPLRDYAGSGEYITVYAVDFAGNKSDTVSLKNPYYSAPTSTPAATPTPAATSTPATPATTTPAPVETSESTESAVPEEPNPFTPDGAGTVMDNVVEQNGKEFFTITTADDNVFYLIIDRERNGENVYLLNAVTEDDLMALAEKSGGTGESAVPEPEPTPQPAQPEPEPTPEPEPEPPAKSGNNTGSLLIILLAVLGVGGAGYYFKILKPKQQAADMDDDYDEDEEDYDGGLDDDYDGYDEDSGDIADDEE